MISAILSRPVRCLLVGLLLVAGVALTAPRDARAANHPVSLLWCLIEVYKDRMEVELVVTVEEFFYVYGLEPDDTGELDEREIQESVEKYKEYLLEHFSMYDADGVRLEGTVTDVKMTSAELALQMEREVTYKVLYPLELPPIKIDIEQSFGGVDSAFPSVMTVEIEQIDYTLPQPFLLEKGARAEVEFDWLASPISEGLADPEELERRRTEALGITSLGSVYTFFYVEETEVRHEILMPVAILETWLKIERAKPSLIEVSEQKAAEQAIFEFFAEHNPLTIDGIEVKPQLERIDFFDLEFKDLAQRPPERPVPVYAARVGVILEYATKGIPDEVEMTWDLFSRDLRDIRMALIAWDQSERVELSQKSPTLTWKNPGRPPLPTITSIEAAEAEVEPLVLPLGTVIGLALLPVVLLVLLARRARGRSYLVAVLVLLLVAGAGWFGPSAEIEDPRAPAPAPPPVDDAGRILASLHKNVYRAFDYRNESDIYDALARSVDGDLLAELYLAIREGLLMQEQGGAVSRVGTVDVTESIDVPIEDSDAASDLDPRAFRRHCSWAVSGSVEHWGHIHSRTNRYEASFTVEPRDQAWKITDLDVTSQERDAIQTSIRKVL